MAEKPGADGTRNSFFGQADAVVQAGSVRGGVHLHFPQASERPLPHQLPGEVTHFTGRDQELRKLEALLEEDRSTRLNAVVISGSPGIGKTSLAVHWAHRAQGRFPDGELYVNLRGFDSGQPVAPEQALDGFLRSLDVHGEQLPCNLNAMVGLYRSMLANRRMLVILDNAATAEQIRPLLPGSPTCKVIVTSRNRLSGLAVRDGAYRIILDMLTADEAISLLRRIIGRDRTDHEPDAAAELARQCTYLPLALRIAAERVVARPFLAIQDFVHTLTEENQRLDALAVDDDETSAVRAVFSWSYRALSPAAARVFRLLSLHPGLDISVHAAGALTGRPTSAVRLQLNILTSVHMISETAHDRYQFHDLLREYAQECATVDESYSERADAMRRVLEWYLHTTHAARRSTVSHLPEIPIEPIVRDCTPLTFNSQTQAIKWFDAEHKNLVAAIWAANAAGEYTIAWQLPNALSIFLSWHQCWDEEVMVHQSSLAAAQHSRSRIGELWANSLLGETYYSLRQYESAELHFCRGLKIARELKSPREEAAELGNLGSVYLNLGRLDEAIENLQSALVINTDIGYKRNQALNLIDIGDAFRRGQRFTEATASIQRGLAIVREVGGLENFERRAVRLLGLVDLDLSQVDQAIDRFREVVTIARGMSHPYSIATALADLAGALQQAGELDEARTQRELAVDILEQLGSPDAATVRAQLMDASIGNPSASQ